jgi:hypothetical protein
MLVNTLLLHVQASPRQALAVGPTALIVSDATRVRVERRAIRADIGEPFLAVELDRPFVLLGFNSLRLPGLTAPADRLRPPGRHPGHRDPSQLAEVCINAPTRYLRRCRVDGRRASVALYQEEADPSFVSFGRRAREREEFVAIARLQMKPRERWRSIFLTLNSGRQ